MSLPFALGLPLVCKSKFWVLLAGDMQTASQQAAAVTVEQYIAANNRHDLQGVMAHLDPACLLILCGPDSKQKTVWMAGADNMQSLYLKDWEQPYAAALMSELHIVKASKGHVGVRVQIRNTASKKDVDVTYVLREADMKMVEHIIHSSRRAPESTS